MHRFLPRRSIGSTGFIATQLGIGDVADRNVPLEQCVRTVQRAMDAGLNVIDTAPNYEAGYSEEIVGLALAGRRENMFVVSKIDHHAQPVGPQVDASLRRLRLDYTDLFVFHALSSMEGWRALVAPDGPIAQLRECVAAGKTRFVGISCHHPLVLIEALRSGLCDVAMFAVGPFVDPRYVEEALPLAKKLGVGTICFKTFGAGKLLADTTGYNQPLQVRPRGKMSSGGSSPPGDHLSGAPNSPTRGSVHGASAPAGTLNPGGVADRPEDSTPSSTLSPASVAGSRAPLLPRLSVRDCVHYTLTCDPDVTLLGMSFPNEQDAAFEAAASFAAPLDPAEMRRIRQHAAHAISEKGDCWWNPPAGE